MTTFKQVFAGVLGAATLAVAAAGPASAATIDTGHVDVLHVGVSGSALTLDIHDESGPVEFPAPATTTLGVKRAAWRTITLDGRSVSAAVLPETQDPNLLFPGLSADDLVPAPFAVDDEITYTLTRASVPSGARVVVASSSDTFFDTGTSDFEKVAALEQPDEPGEESFHSHGAWTFTRAGSYDLTFVATAPLFSGYDDSNALTLHFEVAAP
ncbi:choice-of-anchor M domain-containing protein [Conexibacter sp. CPCC 206217]|uniref:choice-of-anchor M domain-containing protein n=1 Tax=Conexibacter sp. CPCC 206217 TaxID=3064574 RepID=UPI0027169561|nr:choice-of-anchor M domain-containing protein [Conexibacter sp. CPCC 206217]MDO8213126.1 choice-of-anchor M domain-containing protein [Conexibacter sp. CPCC 206217]